MTKISLKSLLFLFLLGHFLSAIGGTTATDDTDDDKATGSEDLIGNSEAGEARYNQSCVNCHGAAGKGVASYPKVSGQDISYTTSRLETYRAGEKVGPNSSLMIMMAKPLTDQEIADLAAYLKDVKN